MSLKSKKPRMTVTLNMENIPVVRDMVQDLTDKVGDLGEAKDQAYWERNQLVAFLAHQYDSHIVNITGNDNYPIVCIHTPRGQMTWHIPAVEWIYFSSLPVTNQSHWDGHTTEEKYAKLWELARA